LLSRPEPRHRAFRLPRNGSFKETAPPLRSGAHGEIWLHEARAHRHPRHRRAELELNLTLSGRAAYLAGDRLVDLPRNGLIWLFPGQDHVLARQTSDFRMWIVVFRSSLVRRWTAAGSPLRGRRPGFDPCREIDPMVARELAATCASLHAGHDLTLLNAGLGYLLLAAWRAFSAAPTIGERGPIDPQVARAALLIRADPTRSGSALADAVGLSRAHLSRRFSAQMGTALRDFRTRARVDRFLHLIDRDGGTALSAALAAGFGSYGQFYRMFRATTGQTPREYLARRGVGVRRAR
jgi:AraC-like DNA-binding protein